LRTWVQYYHGMWSHCCVVLRCARGMHSPPFANPSCSDRSAQHNPALLQVPSTAHSIAAPVLVRAIVRSSCLASALPWPHIGWTCTAAVLPAAFISRAPSDRMCLAGALVVKPHPPPSHARHLLSVGLRKCSGSPGATAPFLQTVGYDETEESGWQANDAMLAGRRNDSSVLYVRSVWWASVTLVTIGFGDIVPTQLGEMFFCIFVMYGGLLTVSVIVGLLMAEITATDVMSSSWQQRVDTASRFIRRCKPPPPHRQSLCVCSFEDNIVAPRLPSVGVSSHAGSHSGSTSTSSTSGRICAVSTSPLSLWAYLLHSGAGF
jgi:hypothetical protein